MAGKLIVIEGLDGSGKATQAETLRAALSERGERVRKISFPNYGSDSSALIRMYLNGAFGSDPSDVNAYAASTFFAVDRYAGWRTDWGAFHEEGGLLVADRYTTSNAIHQCCKLPEAQWDGFLDWLFDLEYVRLGIPRPDLVVFLQMDLDVSQRLMDERYRDGAGHRDIHEENGGYLRRADAAARYCAGRLGWHTIRCCTGGALRSRGEIAAELMELVQGLK